MLTTLKICRLQLSEFSVMILVIKEFLQLIVTNLGEPTLKEIGLYQLIINFPANLAIIKIIAVVILSLPYFSSVQLYLCFDTTVQVNFDLPYKGKWPTSSFLLQFSTNFPSLFVWYKQDYRVVQEVTKNKITEGTIANHLQSVAKMTTQSSPCHAFTVSNLLIDWIGSTNE